MAKQSDEIATLKECFRGLENSVRELTVQMQTLQATIYEWKGRATGSFHTIAIAISLTSVVSFLFFKMIGS